MKVTFILPSVGRHYAGEPYIRSWSMEPLAIAVLSGLMPPEVARKFFDDRFDEIPYGEPTDLVAMSVETYTARRAYQIAARFRQRGIPVVMGGFHPTLVPDEVARHADAVVLGEAEELWPRVIADVRAGCLQPRYAAVRRPSLAGLRADRSIYADKPYLPLTLIETSRGCPHACEFCSISQFFGQSWNARPIAEVVAEIRALKPRTVFFTDDHLLADRDRAKELLRAITPLKLRWAAQATLDTAQDEELIALLHASGCLFVLIGFESLQPAALAAMGKAVNRATDYAEAARRLARHGIGVYATFVFGYDGDTETSFRLTQDFALANGFFFAAFNHIVPFPGTPLYARLQREERLLSPAWWLEADYRFGQVAFRPQPLAAGELAQLCFDYRHAFYRPRNVLRRALANWRANCRTPARLLTFLALNSISRREIARRQNWPLGAPEA